VVYTFQPAEVGNSAPAAEREKYSKMKSSLSQKGARQVLDTPSHPPTSSKVLELWQLLLHRKNSLRSKANSVERSTIIMLCTHFLTCYIYECWCSVFLRKFGTKVGYTLQQPRKHDRQAHRYENLKLQQIFMLEHNPNITFCVGIFLATTAHLFYCEGIEVIILWLFSYYLRNHWMFWWCGVMTQANTHSCILGAHRFGGLQCMHK
jgi:hypothetical protein